MSSSIELNYDEMEEQLHHLLGRFFVAFARLELNLSLKVGGADHFEKKLDRFIDIFGAEVSDHDEEFCRISAWYMAADCMRLTRNRLAHGRWGILPRLQLVSHVSGYPPEVQAERRFSLSKLEAWVKEAELLDQQLGKIAW